MRLQNIRGFRNIDEYVRDKIQRYDAQEKNFENLFFYMFSERENVMAEVSDGYRIKKLTYGECADKIVAVSAAFARALAGVEKGSIVGLYMNNSIEWIQAFWSLLKCGYTEENIDKASPNDMNMYYSYEKQLKYGVVGIEICLLNK